MDREEWLRCRREWDTEIRKVSRNTRAKRSKTGKIKTRARGAVLTVEQQETINQERRKH